MQEYNQCPFQGTQIRALVTYFSHHVEYNGAHDCGIYKID